MSLLAFPNYFIVFLCDINGGMDTLVTLCFLNLLEACM